MPTNETLASAVRDAVAPFSTSPAIGADVTVRLANGETVALTLTPASFAASVLAPPRPALEDDDDDGLTVKQRAIVNAVRGSRDGLTYEQIATKVGRKPTSGSFRRTVDALASEEQEILVEKTSGKFAIFDDTE